MQITSCAQGHINHKQQRQSSHPVVTSLFPQKRKEKKKRREKEEWRRDSRNKMEFLLYLFNSQRGHYIFPR